MELSIVIPVFNESANIAALTGRLDKVLPSLPQPHEVIIVDDGSRDDTVKQLLAARSRYPWLKVLELRRNFGQHAATYAGFDAATGKIVVTLDGDLQNDPDDIPKLLEKMAEGYDVVCGWRQNRKDPFFSRKLPSLIVNKIIQGDAPTPAHDYGCFLRAYTRSAAKELAAYSTTKGWFPVLFSKLGFRVGEAPVRHAERERGEDSKHNVFIRIDQFESVFMGATTKPFQFVEIVGAVAGGMGALMILAALGLWIRYGTVGWVLLMLTGAGLMLWGFLTVVVGMIGEYLVRMNYEVGNKPKYLVRQFHS